MRGSDLPIFSIILFWFLEFRRRLRLLNLEAENKKDFTEVSIWIFSLFSPKEDKNILNDLFRQCLIVKVDIYEVAQVVIISIKKIFESIFVAFNHLLYNEEFVASYFFGQGYSEFGLKLQNIWKLSYL